MNPDGVIFNFGDLLDSPFLGSLFVIRILTFFWFSYIKVTNLCFLFNLVNMGNDNMFFVGCYVVYPCAVVFAKF